MKLRTARVVFCLLAMLAPICRAEPAKKHSPTEVLLVSNARSPVSVRIADEYARRRHITARVSVDCPDSSLSAAAETIALADYERSIDAPIRAYLKAHPQINFIVLTKGIPIRITGAPLGSCDENSKEPLATRGHPSVDSFLAALDYDQLPGTRRISIAGSGAVGAGLINRYWNANEPFSHRKFGGYLVTRLDGYTDADAMALIGRSIEAETNSAQIVKQGSVLFDVQPRFGLGDKATQPGPISGDTITRESEWSEFNADMRHAHDVMVGRNIPDELDLTDAFIGNRANLLGYFSWGSNDAAYTMSAYESLKFAPGSLSDTAVSTSGRTFLPTQGGQSLLADLISHGLTCGKGYVDEPLLQAIASPTIALDRYTAGYTMAESLYAASHFVAWEDIVIGDPLCAPYLHLRKR